MPASACLISTNYHSVILRALPEESLHYNNRKIDGFDIFIASKILHCVQNDNTRLCMSLRYDVGIEPYAFNFIHIP